MQRCEKEREWKCIKRYLSSKEIKWSISLGKNPVWTSTQTIWQNKRLQQMMKHQDIWGQFWQFCFRLHVMKYLLPQYKVSRLSQIVSFNILITSYLRKSWGTTLKSIFGVVRCSEPLTTVRLNKEQMTDESINKHFVWIAKMCFVFKSHISKVSDNFSYLLFSHTPSTNLDFSLKIPVTLYEAERHNLIIWPTCSTFCMFTACVCVRGL